MKGRLYGIDLARFLAIAGMMAAHLAASRWESPWLTVPTDGFPSTLFAVLGGFGVTFASRRYLQQGRSDAAIATTVTRGVVIVVMGLLLGLLPPHPILVVLVPFGTAIALSALVLRARSWVLVAVVAVLSLVSPPILAESEYLYGMAGLAAMPLFGGAYPAITWFTYLTIGMLLARLTLRARRSGTLGKAAGAMAAGGALVCALAWGFGEWYLRTTLTARYYEDAVYSREGQYGHPVFGGWDALFVVGPHSGSTIDVLRTAGAAACIIGLCLLVALPWRSSVPTLMKPLVGAGSAPLTSYVLHLVMTSFALLAAGGMTVFWDPFAPAWIVWWFFWQLAVILLLGAAVAWSGKRGPLEALVSKISGLPARVAADSP